MMCSFCPVAEFMASRIGPISQSRPFKTDPFPLVYSIKESNQNKEAKARIRNRIKIIRNRIKIIRIRIKNYPDPIQNPASSQAMPNVIIMGYDGYCSIHQVLRIRITFFGSGSSFFRVPVHMNIQHGQTFHRSEDR